MFLTKYIIFGAQFEINISYKLRKRLLRDYDNMDELDDTKVIHLFDDVIHNLLLLLNDSLTRFIKHEKFGHIKKELTMQLEYNHHDHLIHQSPKYFL